MPKENPQPAEASGVKVPRTTTNWFLTVLALIVGFGLGSLLTWSILSRYLGSNSAVELGYPKTTSPGPSPSAQKYFDVPELGIKFQTSASLSGLTYLYKYNNGTPTAYFSTVDLSNQSAQCGADATTVGAISQYKSGEKVMDIGVEQLPGAVKVGAFYYFFQGPQAGCSDDKQVLDLQSATIQALRTAAKTIVTDK